jgi:hypothetical protein
LEHGIAADIELIGATVCLWRASASSPPICAIAS